MSSKGLLYDYEVQMAHAMKGDIARGIHAESEASSSNPKYDVFLSFRGSDTRKTFTDHLYWALKQEGYRTFRDDNEIERGENINSELRNAIRNAKMSVIVLSKNFTDSTACLFELETILEHRKASDHVILPVFYDVDPSEIKVQAAKLDFKNKAIKQVKVWSAALKEVASMAGMVSQNQSNGYEVPLIKAIVEFADRKVGDNQDFSTKWERLDKSLVYLSAQEEDIRAKLPSQMLLKWQRPKKEVEVWLGDVASLKADVQEVFGESSRVRLRVQLGKILDKKIREVAELQERGRAFDDLLVDGDEWVAHKERIRKSLMDILSEFMEDDDELWDDDVWVAHTKRIREYLVDTLSELGDGDVWVAHTERIREYLTDTLSEVGNDAVTKRFREYLMDTLPELRDDVETQTIREKLMDTLSELGDGAVWVAHTERIRENLTDTLAELRDDAVTVLQEYSKLGDGSVWVAHTERIQENLTDTLSELRDGAVTKLQEFSELGDGVVQEAHSTVLCAFQAVQNLGWR